MNPEIKAKWLEALRSHQYQQARKYLRTDETHFCCLGVLCDLTAPRRWRPISDGEFCHGSAHAFPDNDILAEADLSELDAEKLANMNDRGKSFAEIADYIEANL